MFAHFSNIDDLREIQASQHEALIKQMANSRLAHQASHEQSGPSLIARIAHALHRDGGRNVGAGPAVDCGA